MSERCSKIMHAKTHNRPCGKIARVEFEGKWFCGLHDPYRAIAREAQRKAEGEAWNQQQKEVIRLRDERNRRADCFDEMLGALKAIREMNFGRDENGRDDFYSGAPRFISAWLIADAAIAKAEAKP